MTDTRSIVDGYFAVWNETDAARRRDLIAQTWSEGANYRDPMLAADGHDGIDAMVATVHEQFPGHRFRLVGEVDSHNDRLRFEWELMDPNTGTALIEGIDFGVVAADGRLQTITGFLDKVPALQEAR